MKNFLMIASLLIMSCTGCFKEEKACTPATAASEEAQIKAYAAANGLTVLKHNTGMYYEVVNPGTGATPNIMSRVFITYTGKLLNGTQFDQGMNPATTGWTLGGLIEGWQIGLPLIKAGGKIRLIIPSSLAYGCNGAGSDIPPNSVLFFEINLIDVQ